jgi:hypothetical protein
LNHGPLAPPGRRERRAFGPAAQTRPVPRRFGRCRIREEHDVLAFRPRRANGPTVNSGGFHSDKKFTVEAVVASEQSLVKIFHNVVETDWNMRSPCASKRLAIFGRDSFWSNATQGRVFFLLQGKRIETAIPSLFKLTLFSYVAFRVLSNWRRRVTCLRARSTRKKPCILDVVRPIFWLSVHNFLGGVICHAISFWPTKPPLAPS